MNEGMETEGSRACIVYVLHEKLSEVTCPFAVRNMKM